MSITPEIQALVDRLNQELGEIEQEATEGQHPVLKQTGLHASS